MANAPPFNAGEVVDEVVRIVGRTFPKNITMSSQVEDGLWTVMGDRTQIHQVLLNLCVNARDAMPNGGKLSVRARNVTLTEAAGPAVARPARPLPVAAGFRHRLRHRAGRPRADFRPVFHHQGNRQRHRTWASRRCWASSRAIMAPSWWTAKSAKARPSAPCCRRSPEAVQSAEAYVPPELPRGSGEAVLIVDDEPEIVAGMRSLLEQHNYRVLVAKNGLEALAVMQQYGQAIDAVVTDIMMPEMDGVQLIRVLRKMHPRLQIVASSGLGKENGASTRSQELEALGVRSFLPKPYGVNDLLESLHGLLRKGRAGFAALN